MTLVQGTNFSSLRKTTPLSPQPIYNRIPKKSECRSMDALSPRRFHIYLGNLQGEFELMHLEIDSLRKERDEYREKFEVQMKELQEIRRSFACKRCKMVTTTPTAPPSSKPKFMNTTRSGSFFQPEPRDRLYTPSGVDLTQEMTVRRSTQRTTLIQKLHSAITPTRSSQSVSDAITKRPKTLVAGTQAVIYPSDLSQASASITDPDPVPKGRNRSIEYNNKVEKELDVETAHKVLLQKRIMCIKFSRDGRYLAAGCYDGMAYIYDVLAGTLICALRKLPAGKDVIRAVCFSHDGKYLATGSWEGELYIWEITTRYVRNAFKGHTRCINSLDFSPNGRLLVSASDDNTVRLWNVHDGATKFLTEDNPTFTDDPSYISAVFSPGGLCIAACHRDGLVRIWSVPTGHLVRRVTSHIGWTYHVAFMPDGKGLMTGGWDCKLRYWDVSSLDSTRLHARLQPKNSRSRLSGVEEQTRPEREFSGHTGPVHSLAISSDGRWLASGSHDRSVRIWDGRNPATQCLQLEDSIYSVDFSPAGCHLASGGEDGTLRIWRYSNATSGDA